GRRGRPGGPRDHNGGGDRSVAGGALGGKGQISALSEDAAGGPGGALAAARRRAGLAPGFMASQRGGAASDLPIAPRIARARAIEGLRDLVSRPPGRPRGSPRGASAQAGGAEDPRRGGLGSWRRARS